MNCTTDDSTGQAAVWLTTGDQRRLLEPQDALHLEPLANVQPAHIILDETLIDQESDGFGGVGTGLIPGRRRANSCCALFSPSEQKLGLTLV